MSRIDPLSVSRQLAEAAVWRSMTECGRRGRPTRLLVQRVLDAMDAYAAELAHAASHGTVTHWQAREPDLYPVIGLLADLLEDADQAGHRYPRRRDNRDSNDEGITDAA